MENISEEMAVVRQTGEQSGAHRTVNFLQATSPTLSEPSTAWRFTQVCLRNLQQITKQNILSHDQAAQVDCGSGKLAGHGELQQRK